jgi:DNA-binding MarR family transcriptional regulator
MQPSTGPPPADEWPELPPRTDGGDMLTETIVTVFRLNARLTESAQAIAAHGGLTAAWWQVLGGVLDRPRSLPQIARLMGTTRQGVRRVADLLVEHGFGEYEVAPDNARTKVLACTERGRWAIHQLALVQRPWADRLAGELTADDLQTTLRTMRALVRLLEAEGQPQDDPPPH